MWLERERERAEGRERENKNILTFNIFSTAVKPHE